MEISPVSAGRWSYNHRKPFTGCTDFRDVLGHSVFRVSPYPNFQISKAASSAIRKTPYKLTNLSEWMGVTLSSFLLYTYTASS